MPDADKLAPCAMYTQEPYPFAWCETHDETFALGGICPYYTKEPTDA